MYFADFTAYCYGTFYGPDRIIPLDEVRMIGWLESGYPYSKGQVEEETLLNLRKVLVMSPRSALRSKGFYDCDFCPISANRDLRPKIYFEGKGLTLGSSEIWLPSTTSPNLIYAAPSLIYHYIVEHSYRPPNEFLEAVNNFDIDSDWNAFEEFEGLLEKHRNRIRSEEEDK